MKRHFLALTLVLVHGSAHAVPLFVSDFSSYAGTGVAPGGTDGALDSDRWRVLGLSDGPTAFGGTAVGGDFGRGLSSGGVTSGGLRAFRVGPENAVVLGVQPTGADLTPGRIELRIANTLPRPAQPSRLDFLLWTRNDAPRATRISLLHRHPDDAEPTPVPGAVYRTPEAADVTPEWRPRSLSVRLPRRALAPGEAAVLGWDLADAGGRGARDEIAIGDLRLDAVLVPAPPSLLLAATAALALAAVSGRRPRGRGVCAIARGAVSRATAGRGERAPDPVVHRVRVNGRAVGEIALVPPADRRRIEIEALELPAVARCIGDRTVRSVRLADDGTVDIVA